ncbi:hypothetical protein BH10BAC3_BH10BAC3_25000 [soil metagenome]
MIRLLLVTVLFLTSACTWAQKPAWTKAQLMNPAELAMQLKAGKDVPVIICVGPGASIPHSIDAGMAKDESNVEKLKAELSKLPKDTKLVIYCGCCPFEHCPNAKPAMDVLKAMNFTNYYLLNLPANLKKDWIDKGYPVTN